MGDMWVLDTIRVMQGEKAGVFVKYKEEVVQGFRYKKDDKSVNCGEMTGKKAVHLSHQSTDNAIQNEVFPLDVDGLEGALEHRGEAAIQFLKDWREKCRGAKVSEEKK